MQREAFLRGRWYPGTSKECIAAIEHHAAGTTPQKRKWRGLIGPHAGWTYSGNTAARTYRWLAESTADAELVVIFGSHRGPLGPNTVFVAESWDTPLGPLATSVDLARRVRHELKLHDEPVHPAHTDNGVEVHLPFIRHYFPKAELLMLGVAASLAALQIGQHVGEVCRERDAVFIGSTDLTHYGPNYDFMPAGHGGKAERWVREKNDQGFIDRLLADDPAGVVSHALTYQSACCPGAAAAALEACRASGHAPTPVLVHHELSSAIAPSESFVGYAGVTF